MQQSVLHRLVADMLNVKTMGTYQTAGTLDELAPQRTSHRAGRFSRVRREGGWANLQFPRQVVGQHHVQQVDLVPDPGERGDITHLRISSANRPS